jgi:hypothetical protein
MRAKYLLAVFAGLFGLGCNQTEVPAGQGQGGGGAGATTGTGGSAAAGATGGQAACDPSRAYALTSNKLPASLVPALNTGGWGEAPAGLPLGVDPATSRVYVGFTVKTASSYSANIVAEDGTGLITVPDAIDGGIAVTPNGFGILLFDPASSQAERKWAAVARLGTDGSRQYSTDLFRSANLTDENTKGEPSTSRLVYVAAADQLLAYFGHTMMVSGTRHQGGYLAMVNAAGTQTVLSSWFGSHNLDQRALADGQKAAVLGLGDAYPRGIIFAAVSATSKPGQGNSIYPLAANGVGAANGQLGGIQDGGDVYVIPFVTNRSLAQDFSAGEWPNTDQTKSDQIAAAAAYGTDLGLLRMSKTTAAPSGGLTATWLDAKRGAELGVDTAISQLKSARYCGGYYLLAWKETSTASGSKTSGFFTLVVDGNGTVIQPKARLPTGYDFMAGDDFVTRPDGRISWSNYVGNQITVVTLTP